MRFDKTFFEKHQSVLLRLARSKWTRWLLGLHRMPKEAQDIVSDIQKITPSSIHTSKLYLEDGKLVRRWHAAMYTRARFSEALVYNLYPLVSFLSKDRKTLIWRVSPVGALALFLAPFIPNLGFLGAIGTVTDFSFGSGDGFVGFNGGTANNSFSTWRDATSGNTSSTTTTDGNDGSQAGSPNIFTDGNTRYSGSRVFYPVDTSSLGSGANISAASLFICSDANASRVTYANNAVEITESTVVSDTALANADFNNWNNTKWATGIMHDSLAASGSFNEFVLNATGYGAINKTGFSKYCARYAFDVDNSAPGLGAGQRIVASFRFSEYAGTSSDPYLRVTYTNATIVTPSALAITASLGATTQRLDRVLSVSAQAITATVSAPTIAIRKVVSVDLLPITAALEVPNIIAGRLVFPSTLAITASLESALNITTGTVVPVDNLSAIAAVNVPSFTVGWTVFPDALDISATLKMIASRWNTRTKPTSIWTDRTPPTTNWN